MKRILIINIFGIGDVLFTTPILRNIQANCSDAVIGYVANKRTAGILKNHPLVNNIHVYERDDFKAAWGRSKRAYFRSVKNLLQEIRREQYDTVLDLSLNGYASFITWLLGIPERIGFNYKGRSPFLSRKIKFQGYEGRHVVEFYLELLRELKIPTPHRHLEIFAGDEDERWARQFCEEQHFFKDRKVVAVFPGGGASWGADARFKRWPAERYGQLINKIAEKLLCDVLLMGDAQERELCGEIASSTVAKVISLCGKTSLGQTVALLGHCDMAVVNDGGPLHMAVARGVRTVSVFGPVDPGVYGPYPKDGHLVVTHDVACRPCYRQFRRASCEHISCLKNIDVNAVFANIEQVYQSL